MCKSVHLVTTCPVCFTPSPAHAGENGQHSETILCPEAFHTKQACGLTAANDVDPGGVNLPLAQHNRLGKEMCDQCQPFFKESSASMSANFSQLFPNDLVGDSSSSRSTDADRVKKPAYEAIHRLTRAAPDQSCSNVDNKFRTRPFFLDKCGTMALESEDELWPMAPRWGFESRGGFWGSGFAYGSDAIAINAAAEVALASKQFLVPKLPDFLKIASLAGWTASDRLGTNLNKSTKLKIAEDFLKLVDDHVKRTNLPGRDWLKDPILRLHYPKVVEKLIELRDDPNSMFHKPGNQVMAGPGYVSITDGESGEATFIDLTVPLVSTSTSTWEPKITILPPGRAMPTLRAKDYGAGIGCIVSGPPAFNQPQTSPNKVVKPTKTPKSTKTTKPTKTTPTKQIADGKTAKTASPKKVAAASPMKAIASPKKPRTTPKKNTVKSKPKPVTKATKAAKGKAIAERLEKEKEGSASPAERTLRKR